MHMTSATLESTLSPAAALAVLAELLPAKLVPSSDRGLLGSSARGAGPPTVLIKDGVPGPGRRRYEPAALYEWALTRQPAAVRDGLCILRLLQRYREIVFSVHRSRDLDYDWPELAFACDHANSWTVVDDSSHPELNAFASKDGKPLGEAVREILSELDKDRHDGPSADCGPVPQP